MQSDFKEFRFSDAAGGGGCNVGRGLHNHLHCLAGGGGWSLLEV